MENNYQTYSMYRSWNDVQIFEYFVIRANFSTLLLYLSQVPCTIAVQIKILENVLDDSTILLQNKH